MLRDRLIPLPRDRESFPVTETVNLLPGPVTLAPGVAEAFADPIIYHRSDEFLEMFESLRARLSSLVGGVPVALFVGSGTLGNEVVASTLASDPARDNGLLLITGEFGERLLGQAVLWGLKPKVLRWSWGQGWNLPEIEDHLRTMPAGGWIWGVHHETSTGVLHNLHGLISLAEKYDQRICLDCVSSLGTVDIDLNPVYMATGTSGKALASYPGLAMVFAHPERLNPLKTRPIPGYLDLAATLRTRGPRYTVPSPLVRALLQAMEVFATPESRQKRFHDLRQIGRFVREALQRAGLPPLCPAERANPAIVTFAPPGNLSSQQFVSLCEEWGYQVAGLSGYLVERRLAQIALMGHVTIDQLTPLLSRLEERFDD